MKYDNVAIGKELLLTSTGGRYYGNSLYAAKDIPGLSSEERNVLFRYLNHTTHPKDSLRLKAIACKLMNICPHCGLELDERDLWT